MTCGPAPSGGGTHLHDENDHSFFPFLLLVPLFASSSLRHSHEEGRQSVATFTLDFVDVLRIVAVNDHGGVERILRVNLLLSLPKVLSNFFHFLSNELRREDLLDCIFVVDVNQNDLGHLDSVAFNSLEVRELLRKGYFDLLLLVFRAFRPFFVDCGTEKAASDASEECLDRLEAHLHERDGIHDLEMHLPLYTHFGTVACWVILFSVHRLEPGVDVIPHLYLFPRVPEVNS